MNLLCRMFQLPDPRTSRTGGAAAFVFLLTLPFACFIHSTITHAEEKSGTDSMIVVIGAPGSDDYLARFQEWAGRWEKAASKGNVCFQLISPLEGPEIPPQRDLFLNALEKSSHSSAHHLWLIFLGHGSFDGREARFNFVGPDLSAEEFAAALAPLDRPVAFINSTSSSAPFIDRLSRSNMIVVAATQSGYEQNFTRFGDYLSRSLHDLSADLDKDQQISLLEAFLVASRRTTDFYEKELRIVTEHALIDDNGDGRGTPADWFKGVRAVKKAADQSTPDGWRAHQWHLVKSEREQQLTAEQRQKRDELELEIFQLREKKDSYPVDDYYARLESLLVKLAKIYQDPKPDSSQEE